jgi:hypothetical protein
MIAPNSIQTPVPKLARPLGRSRRLQALATGIVAALLLGVPSVAEERDTYTNVPWSTVGSAASIDESHLGNFYTRREVLGIRDQGTIVGRWAVSDTHLDGKQCATLRVRFNESGAEGAVYVRLIRTGIDGGSSTRADFYSENIVNLEPGWQTREVYFSEDFDLVQNAYFLEAWIHKLGPTGVAEIGVIQLQSHYCID